MKGGCVAKIFLKGTQAVHIPPDLCRSAFFCILRGEHKGRWLADEANCRRDLSAFFSSSDCTLIGADHARDGTWVRNKSARNQIATSTLKTKMKLTLFLAIKYNNFHLVVGSFVFSRASRQFSFVAIRTEDGRRNARRFAFLFCRWIIIGNLMLGRATDEKISPISRISLDEDKTRPATTLRW